MKKFFPENSLYKWYALGISIGFTIFITFYNWLFDRKELIFMDVNELAEKILIICIENKITASKLLKAVSKVIVEFHSKGTIEK